jgi:hypothetical protein
VLSIAPAKTNRNGQSKLLRVSSNIAAIAAPHDGKKKDSKEGFDA